MADGRDGPGITRRAFLGACAALPLVAGLQACGLESSPANPQEPAQGSGTRQGNKVTLPGSVGDYPVGSVTLVREGRFFLAHVPEGLLALYWPCTDAGCTVVWKPDQEFEGNRGIFACPCHEATFLRNGLNVSGPPPRPLDYMSIEVSDGKITVDTSSVHERKKWDPSQAVKV